VFPGNELRDSGGMGAAGRR